MIIIPSNTAALAPPTITGFSPTSLSNGGGNVTISGSNFINGATTVKVNGTTYAATYNSTVSLTVGFPTLGRGTYTVTVTTPGGSASSNFTYYWTPYISSISPSSVYYDYGSGYTIYGGRFSSSAAGSVYVWETGSYHAVSVASDGQLTFNPGALATGSYTAYVVAPDGWSGGVGFTTSWYAAPSISSVSDGRSGRGSQTGSTITLSGSGFTGASVTIGGTSVSASVSDTSISFTCPNLSTDGTKTITVTTARSGNKSASTSVYFWGAKSATTTSYTSGSGSYTIPGWANSVDCVCVGGGQGGGAGNITTGKGGKAGSWSGATSTATGTLSYSVGGGGAKGPTYPYPGSDGGTSTAGSASGAGGSGDSNGGPGLGAGNYTYNGVTYTGGGQQSTWGANGNAPGGGGCGGGIAAPGGNGADGAVWFRAVQ